MAVCPVVAAFEERMTASLDAETRTRLLAPHDSKLADSRGSRAVEVKRAFIAADWLVRSYVPGWLRVAGLEQHAVTIETLPALTSARSVSDVEATTSAVLAAVVEWRATVDVGEVDPVWDQRDGSNAAWMAIYTASKDETGEPWKVASIYQAAQIIDRIWMIGWLAAQVVTSRGLSDVAVEAQRVSSADLYRRLLDATGG